MTAANPTPAPPDTPRGQREPTVPGGCDVASATGWQVRVGRFAIVAATAFVAVTAFVLAYDGSRGAASDAGITAAGWYPFCIEGVIVCASVATLLLRHRPYPWVILLGFTAVSVAANVLHAYQHPGGGWWSLGFAAVPPLTLPICVHLLLMVAQSGEPTVAQPVVHELAQSVVHDAMIQEGQQYVGQGMSRDLGHADPAVQLLDQRVIHAADHAVGHGGPPLGSGRGPAAPEPAAAPPAEPVEPRRITLPQPPRGPRRGTVQRTAGKPRDPRAGQRVECACGCGEMVSRMTSARHAERAEEAARRAQELAGRALSNGHSEKVTVP